MNKMSDAFGMLFVVVAFIVVVGMIMALPVMWLWNLCLIPAVAGVSEIGWLQAWGISILFGLLFKNSSTSIQKGE